MTGSRLKFKNAQGLELSKPICGLIIVLRNSSPITATFGGTRNGKFSRYMPVSTNTEI